MHYCAWQERAHQDVKDKLYSFGLYGEDVDILMAQLIEENYLNEERFARQYVGGKFRSNHCGRIKILAGLKQKRVSIYNCNLAMKEIEEEAYWALLQKLALAKWDSLKSEQYLNRQGKTRNYLLQKGFENELIGRAIKELKEK